MGLEFAILYSLGAFSLILSIFTSIELRRVKKDVLLIAKNLPKAKKRLLASSRYKNL